MKRMMALGMCCMLLITACTAWAEAFTPGRETCGHEHCFWETSMDITKEAIWAMLTQPMTVLSGDLRGQTRVYARPDASCEAVGEVTCMSQSVHELEQPDNGWSRIECYSSSFKGSQVEAWYQLVVGYVRSELLTERKVKTQYGLVVDKLTQRLYLFHDGGLMDTLTVSTGLADADHPWNETRSGA